MGFYPAFYAFPLLSSLEYSIWGWETNMEEEEEDQENA